MASVDEASYESTFGFFLSREVTLEKIVLLKPRSEQNFMYDFAKTAETKAKYRRVASNMRADLEL